MIAEIGSAVQEAHTVGLPVLIIAYPRSEGDGTTLEHYTELRDGQPDQYLALLEHTVRLAVELGADLVKTQYFGGVEVFRRVVEVADGVPVLVAGGPQRPIEDVFAMASSAIEAGAKGVSFGRNVFDQADVSSAIRGLRAIVHDGISADAALQMMSRSERSEPSE